MRGSDNSTRWQLAGVMVVVSSLVTGCVLHEDYEVGPGDTSEPEQRDTTVDTGMDTHEPEDTREPMDTAMPVDTQDTAETGGDADAMPTPDNMLENPGFEEGSPSGGCPVAWTCVTYNPKEAGEFSGEATARTGDYAAKWTGDPDPSVVIKQSQPATPGHTYAVSVWVKSEGVSKEPFVEILFDDENGESLHNEPVRAESVTDEWTHITGTTSAAPSGTESMRFNMSLPDSGGTVWWDDASLIEQKMPGDNRDAGTDADAGGGGSHGVTVGGGSDYLAERRAAGEETYCNQQGTVVSTYSGLVDALDNAGSGDVVYIEGSAEIDMQDADDLRIPEGITLASDRGCNGAEGGLLYTTNHPWSLFRAEADVTVFGVRIRGPREDWTPYPGENSGEIGAGIKIQGTGVEIANSELSGFSHFAIQTDYDSKIHHNHIHHNPVDGLGYGVSVTGGHPIIEYNQMNYNRHSVAAGGNGTSYTARYNVVGPDSISHIFDQHKPGGKTTRIHHNTVEAVEQTDDNKNTPAVTIRGVPSDIASIHHNWIFNTEAPCHSNDNWPGCAILQMHVDDWKNVDFHDNHFGTSEPNSCDVGAPREGCPAP